uniref:Uncharacterized protein n=1 Tax=Glossina brevipalpis TaxID=37001 RepID=A0A1A9W4B6_9MUSC
MWQEWRHLTLRIYLLNFMLNFFVMAVFLTTTPHFQTEIASNNMTDGQTNLPKLIYMFTFVYKTMTVCFLCITYETRVLPMIRQDLFIFMLAHKQYFLKITKVSKTTTQNNNNT